MRDVTTRPTRPAKPEDTVYREPRPVADFEFDEAVASVFDDMLNRSVPFYQEIQRMIAEMATDFATGGSNIYDLGCSTGNTLRSLGAAVGKTVKLIGVDYSEDMLKRCRDNLADHGFEHAHELICTDLNQGMHIEGASMVTMVLTMQFIRPLYRDTLTRSILQGLNDTGCLILVEKVLGEHSIFNRASRWYRRRPRASSRRARLQIPVCKPSSRLTRRNWRRNGRPDPGICRARGPA